MTNPNLTGQSDEAIGRRRRNRRKDAEKQLEADYQWLMSTKAGRRLVWLWMDRGGVYRTTFRPHAGEMNLLEGRRNITLELVSDLNTFTPQEYDLMHQENRPTRAQPIERNDDREPDTDAGTNE